MPAPMNSVSFVKHDDYMTPKYAWENINHIIKYFKKENPDKTKIWEAFYGDGVSGDYLTELGHDVIHEEINFFDDDTLPDYGILISNPPFSKSKEVMNRLMELNKPFIIIMPAPKICTSYFRAWKDKGLQIIIPRKRIHFRKMINGENVKNWKNACCFDCFYYCYKIGLPHDIIWLED